MEGGKWKEHPDLEGQLDTKAGVVQTYFPTGPMPHSFCF